MNVPTEITIYPSELYQIFGAIALVMVGYFIYKKVVRVINRS